MSTELPLYLIAYEYFMCLPLLRRDGLLHIASDVRFLNNCLFILLFKRKRFAVIEFVQE